MSEEEKIESQPRPYLEAQKTEIHYTYARFHRRIFANLTDFLIFALTFAAFFAIIRAIVVVTPDYVAKEERMMTIRKDSGMYQQNTEGKWFDTVSFYADSANGFTGFAKMVGAREAIDQFIVYVNDNVSPESADIVRKDYDSYRLNPKLAYQGKPYFILQDGEIIRNPDCAANAETVFTYAYAPFIDEHCQGYLITLIPEYLALTRWETTVFIAGEIVPAYLIAPILTYFVPTLGFRRGRATFGKKMYQIGLVDSRLLVPTFRRSLARFAILYFAEYLLAPFTFAIPFLVSASVMAFSKAHQGLPDYFLGLYEVDVSQNKIYFSREEILLSGAAESKKPVDFKPTYED